MDDAVHKSLGVAEQHQRVVEVIERIVDTGEAGTHAALDDHHGAGFVHVKNRHAENGAGLVGARGWIGNIVGSDHQRDVRLGKVAVDVIHLDELVVRDVSLSQEHVHVTGHTSGHRMNGEANVY